MIKNIYIFFVNYLHT